MPKEKETKKRREINKFRLGLGILVLVALVYYLRSYLVAATVNGKPILRFSVIRQLERQGGANTLDNMITEALVTQEAQKQGITVLPKTVNEEIEKISTQMSDQGQDLDEVLMAQGMTRADLATQVRLQKIVEEIFADEIQVSGEEIDQYLENYGSTISEEMTDEEKREMVKEQLKQQKLSENFYSWIEGLKADASISRWVNY